MTRSFKIPGESLVSVKGGAGTSLAGGSQLTLATDQIQVSITPKHEDVVVNAWGRVPPDVQMMLAEAMVTINGIHTDMAVVQTLLQLALAAPAEGQLPHAGTLMGGGFARYAAGWNYVSLNISSPIANLPWCFLNCYLADNVGFPLGVEAQVQQLRFRCIPYTVDPWNGGAGASGSVLWTHVLNS